MSAVSAHTGGRRPEDDQSLLVIHFSTDGGGEPVRMSAHSENRLAFRLENHERIGESINHHLRPRFFDWLKRGGWDQESTQDVWSATWEAVLNALRHGSDGGERIELEFRRIGPGTLSVRLTQPKAWPEWRVHLGPQRRTQLASGEQTSIAGTVIMLRLASSISMDASGTTLEMLFTPRRGKEEN
jgi:anti-sigma regulatory factor (Ser/Thr protein kinase)